MHTTRILRLTENLPIKIEFIDRAEKVEEILPKLYEMAGTGLIEVQDTNVVKPSQVSAKTVPESQRTTLKREGKAKLMRILHRRKRQMARQAAAQGAGGVHARERHRGRDGVSGNSGLRRESANSQEGSLIVRTIGRSCLSVVDNEEKLRAFVPLLDEMVQQGLVVLSDVDIVKYTHDFATAERRKESRAMKLEGKAKMLRIHFGEDDKWQGKPLLPGHCREMPRAGYRRRDGVPRDRGLRREHADPHVAHLLSFSHDAPVMVSVIDSEEKIAKLLPHPGCRWSATD